MHRSQLETPKAGFWGANGRRISPGRFRVVGCRAFRLDFEAGLGIHMLSVEGEAGESLQRVMAEMDSGTGVYAAASIFRISVSYIY
jgi:hypothetical protein